MNMRTKLAIRFLTDNGGASANDQITMLARAIDEGRMGLGQARMTAALIHDWSTATRKEKACSRKTCSSATLEPFPAKLPNPQAPAYELANNAIFPSNVALLGRCNSRKI